MGDFMIVIRKKAIFLICFAIFFCILSTMFFLVPDLSIEKITEISQTLTIYDKDENVSAVLNAGQNRQSVSFEDVPEHVVNALIATEDVRFYEHNGIDVKRIFGALIKNVTTGSLKEGASTITQQLIKNSHLSNEKTFLRKFNEAVLAIQLERRYEKNEILEMYLNFVYFGRGAYGIQAASQAYFGLDVQDLSIQQGATLIGILKAPSKYAPHLNMENSVSRRNVVLSQMLKYGFITEDQFEECKKEEIVIVEKSLMPDYGYYTDYVLEESAEKLGITVSDLLAGGYKIYTCQDSYVQEKLQEIYNDTNLFPQDDGDEMVQSATVVINNSNGALCSMIGGREHEGMRVYNRAKAKRQPGSCIKPILVYAPAFENKSITPLTVLNDYRKDFSGYSPTNFKDVYYGDVTVRQALSLSLNVPAVELLNKNGINYSKKYAQNCGITFHDDDNHLALALGGMKYGTSPLELAGAYSTFARSGTYVEPWCIEKITDNEGNLLYRHQEKEIRVFSESTAYLITDILTDVSQNTNNRLSILKKDIACKTGTVGYENGNSDVWSTAYDNMYTVCVWMGYDKTTNENFLSDAVTGSTYPSNLCAEIYKSIYEKYDYSPFVKPNTIVKKAIDGFSLKNEQKIYLANKNIPITDVIYEYFDLENAPTEYNKYWNIPELPENISIVLNELRQPQISFTAKESYVEYVVYKKGAYGEKELKRVSANKDEKIYIIDEDYSVGDAYLIQAIHKEVLINGKPFYGEKSREYYIY